MRYGSLMRGVVGMLVLCSGLACGRSESATPAAVAPRPESSLAAEHAALVQGNPPGLSLELRVASDQAHFRLGEPIPLLLTFSETGAERYTVAVHEYDRSGRMWSETFVAAPRDDAPDPLLSHFRGLGGMGGISALPRDLHEGPVEIPLTLNEWVRFDRPGTHQLFVTSERAGQPATSNIVDIEVEDDPEWARAELKRIRDALAADPEGEVVGEAMRSLRFLATDAAADEIAKQMCLAGETYVSDLHFGAHGVRDRTHMIAALEAALVEPDCAVGESYLGTLTRLQIPEAVEQAEWATAYGAAVTASVSALEATLGGKTGRARAVSTHTVLTHLREQEQREGVVDAAAESRRAELAAVFETLPDDARARVLADEWHTIRSPELGVVLARMVKRATPRGGRLRSLSDLALERWLELDPKAARAFILDELARPGGARVSFSPKTLGRLPERTLPQLDAALIAGARATAADGGPVSDGATLELRAEVIARYASAAVLADVWELYRGSTYFRMSLLTYLVREDPTPATTIVAALGFDDLHRLAQIEWSQTVQTAVLAHVQQPEPHRAERATTLLATHADATVLPVLWKKLAALKRDAPAENSPEANLHRRIRRSIATGRGWTLTTQELQPLMTHCFDDACRSDVAGYVERWNDGRPAFVLWSHAANGEVTGWLGQYSFGTVAELEQKVQQLPRGTVLVWGTKPAEVERTILAKVEALADAQGVTFELPATVAAP